MKPRNILILSSVLCTWLNLGSTSQAQSLINASFEQPYGTQGYDEPSSQIPGWTLSQGGVYIFNNVSLAGNAFDGTQFLDLVGGSQAVTSGSTISQPITSLIVGQVYQVSFVVSALENPAYFGLSSVFVSAGNGSDSFSLDPSNDTLGYGDPWIPRSFIFTADSDSVLLSIISSRPGGVGSLPAIDNFSVMAVPEPSTNALFASGAAVLLLGLRRKHKIKTVSLS